MSRAPTDLLRAAVAVLEQDGAGALTVRAVADRAGCSTTGIYTWFGGKVGLVDAVVADGLASLDRALAPAYQAADPLAVVLAYRRWALANRTLYLLMLGQAVPGYRAGPVVRLATARALVRLRRLLAEHEVDDREAVALRLHAIAHGHVMLELVGIGPGTGEVADRALEAAVLAAVATPAERSDEEGAPDERR